MFLQTFVHKSYQNACIPAFIHVLMIGIVLQEVYFEKNYAITPVINFIISISSYMMV